MTPPVPVGDLLFSDDFATLDTSKWYAKRSGHPRTSSLADWCGFDTVQVKNGRLTIQALRDPVTGRYRSAEITTEQLPPFTGRMYVEAVAKVAKGAGTWSAPLWLWPYPYGAAPGVEIDVCEQLGKESKAYHATVHNWRSETDDVQQGMKLLGTAGSPLLHNEFHRYGALIDHQWVDFYFNGAVYSSVKAADVGVDDFTTKQYTLLADLDMGGSWAGTPAASLVRAAMELDSVNVWRLA